MQTARGQTSSKPSFEAAIFDLDGVVTQTARVHADAWKAMFDEYLEQRQAQGKDGDLRPFDKADDYLQYVDGKPRYDGVSSFLASRGINLPLGNENDAPTVESIRGLGNRKNILFQEQLREKGPDVFESSARLIRDMRKHGWKTAVVSSSKNCVAVLEAAGLLPLFHTKVDGLDSEELQLQGKPAPDIFLEAAERLQVKIDRTIAFEDALAGVDAASRAGCGVVVGVHRAGSAEALGEHGADVVVEDLSELSEETLHRIDCRNSSRLPNAMEQFESFWELIREGQPLLFLDYDGTLSPIVNQPESATLAPETRAVLERFGTTCPVAIVSGRDCADIARRVGIPSFYYAGSHGFEISHPDGSVASAGEGESWLESLNTLEQELKKNLASIPGALVERKRFSVAVHYRNVDEDHIPDLREASDAIAKHHPKLRRSDGKKLIEFHPGVDWHKGKAVEHLMAKMAARNPVQRPVYIGDDTTDEDAFRVVHGRGAGIYVRTERRPTRASFALEDTREVACFLDRFLQTLQART